MLNIQAMQLMHRHDDERWAPMTESGPHGPAAQDDERRWPHGARVFRCTECKEEVVIGPPEPPRSVAGGAG